MRNKGRQNHISQDIHRAANCLEPVDGSTAINAHVVQNGWLHTDVIEIDAASNNGVDDVREIKEAIMYVQRSRYKVYIIDEVHMLSTGAFNALLKTLEEPPENMVFILATTEPQKLQQRYYPMSAFRPQTDHRSGLEERLKIIAENCSVSVDNSAIQLIARLSEGV